MKATTTTLDKPSALLASSSSRNYGATDRYEDLSTASEDSDSDDSSSGSSNNIEPSNTDSSGTSTGKAMLLLLKSFIGSAVLFLPRAFYNGGMLFSTAALVISAAISLWTMIQLSRCYMMFRGGYGTLGRKIYGRGMEQAIVGSIVISQIGFACASTIFVAASLRDVFNAATGCTWRQPIEFWVAAQLAVLIPLCLVRHIGGLAGVATAGDIFIALGLGYVFFMDTVQLKNHGIAKVRAFNSENYPLMLGSAAYTFEGFALILPIAGAMRRKKSFPPILSIAVGVTAAVAVVVGALSYAAFGERTESIILLNMPSRTAPTLAVQTLYAIAIVFSIPLMLHPVTHIFDHVLFPSRSGKHSPKVKQSKNALRIGLLIAVAAAGAFGAERVDKLVAVIGGVACVPIAFVYPPLLHLKAISRTWCQRIRDGTIAVFGILLTIYVTYGAIARWGDTLPPLDFCDAL